MTNRRRSPVRNAYRSGFLSSTAWFARRARWFRKQARSGGVLACAVCDELGTERTLELHHLDYAGVSIVDGQWRAFEQHCDLIPMDPRCHELLHRLIDRDTVLTRQRTRRDASITAIEALRSSLAPTKEHA